jgi:hypothetical protein
MTVDSKGQSAMLLAGNASARSSNASPSAGRSKPHFSSGLVRSGRISGSRHFPRNFTTASVRELTCSFS